MFKTLSKGVLVMAVVAVVALGPACSMLVPNYEAILEEYKVEQKAQERRVEELRVAMDEQRDLLDDAIANGAPVETVEALQDNLADLAGQLNQTKRDLEESEKAEDDFKSESLGQTAAQVVQLALTGGAAFFGLKGAKAQKLVQQFEAAPSRAQSEMDRMKGVIENLQRQVEIAQQAYHDAKNQPIVIQPQQPVAPAPTAPAAPAEEGQVFVMKDGQLVPQSTT